MLEREASSQEKFTFEYVVRTAIESALKSGGQTPMLIAQGRDQAVVALINEMPPTFEERCQMMFAIGLDIADTGRTGPLEDVFFITEGWMSQPVDGKIPDMPPSQDPNRVEVLVISARGKSMTSGKIAICEMHRDSDGQLAELLEKPLPGGQDLSAEVPLLDAFFAGYEMRTNGRSD